MANSQLSNPTGNVLLRKRTELFEPKKQVRASKVTSMIEVFSNHDDRDDVIGSTTKKPFRNQTFLEHRPKQEVIHSDHQKRIIVPAPRGRKPIQSTVPIGLRVPKPYAKQGGTSTASDRTDNTSEALSKTLRGSENNNTQRDLQHIDEVATFDNSDSKRGGINYAAQPATQNHCAQEDVRPIPRGKTKTNAEMSLRNGRTTEMDNRTSSPVRKPRNFYNRGQSLSTRETSGEISPRFSPRNATMTTASPEAEERRIINARNYWESKIDTQKDSSAEKLDSDYNQKKPIPSPKPWSAVNASPARNKLDNSGGERSTDFSSSGSSHNLEPDSRTAFFSDLSPTSHRRLNSIPQADSGTKGQKTIVAERLKKFGQTTIVKPGRNNDGVDANEATRNMNDLRTPDARKVVKFSPQIDDGSNSGVPLGSPHRAAPPRPRFRTSAAGLQPNPGEQRKVVSSFRNESNTQNLSPNFVKRPVSPLARSHPLSPLSEPHSDPIKKAPPKLPEKPKSSPHRGAQQPPERPTSPPHIVDKNITSRVNPVPKPQRTFTFTLADLKTSPQIRPKHPNLGRVSSDITSIKEPGNLASVLSEELRQSMPDVSASREEYEQVNFCEVLGTKSSTMQVPRNTQKWHRQHNYEEVDNSAVNSDRRAFTANYDRIDLGKVPPPRPASLTDLSSNYSHLTFQQDLHASKSRPPPPSASSSEHLKLRKQNSDMSDSISWSSSFSKSDSGSTPKITDKIRDAFTQISKKYKHRRRSHDDNEDSKSFSSSGDEDSDTETDIIKHKQTLDKCRNYQKIYRTTVKYKSMERELSRYEDLTLFEQVLICKIVKGADGKFASKVSYRFPAPPPGKALGDEKTLAHFCFPDIDVLKPCEEMPSQSYAFMLTRENGTRKFGYCRRILPPGTEPRYPVVYCLISPLGSFGLYELILDELERRHRTSLKKVSVFLDGLFVARFPAPGRSVSVTIDEADGPSRFVLRRPFDTRLEHVDLQCLLTEVGVENAIRIFASLLLERRVILCGNSLSTLTACIHALRALLYPFVWQHVFVPVLPPPMVDLCCSPTPLLIGIMDTSIEKLKTLPLEEAFIFNLVTRETISSMGDEMDLLPRKLQTPLINTLGSFASGGRGSTSQPSYDFAMDYESAERNTVISEAFMHLFVEMIGHYQHHFQPVIHATNAQTKRFGKAHRNFNKVSFYDDVTSRSLKRFLDLFMGTQMFDGFIHSRELANSDYEGLFEQRIAHHIRNADASQLNFRVIKTKMKKLMQGIGKKK